MVLSYIKNIYDNKFFKWCLIRCYYPKDHHPARTRTVDKNLEENLISKTYNFPSKLDTFIKLKKGELHQHQSFSLRKQGKKSNPMITLKIIVNKLSRYLKNMNIDSKIMIEKKSPL